MTSKETLREILLQALFINPNNQTKEDINNKMFECYEIVLKKLDRLAKLETAIKILKKYDSSINIQGATVTHSLVMHEKIIKEEYDLLNEVLENDK